MEEETKVISEVPVTKVVEEVDHKGVDIKVLFSLHYSNSSVSFSAN